MAGCDEVVVGDKLEVCMSFGGRQASCMLLSGGGGV